MPKRILKFLTIMTALISLLFVFSCSTGDKGGVERSSITDVISGNNPVSPSGLDGLSGLGGTGGTGKCVMDADFCYQGIDQMSCEWLGGSFASGQTCGASYPNCSAPMGGVSLCSSF